MDKLNAYKLDKAFTEGVDIPLDGADVTCRVRLPSQYNRAYTQAMYGKVQFDVSEGGNVKPGGSLVDIRYAQEDAFVDHCLISIDGEPVPADFAQHYPAALAELVEKATQLAGELETKVATSVKKSSTISSGNDAGAERSDSTPNLNSGAA